MASEPLLGVSAAIFRADKVLLVERARPPFQGLFSLPGGRVRFGEPLENAIRREVCEETGLSIDGYAFHCLHEAIEPGVHAVIAVYRATEALRQGLEPVAADDARTTRFASPAELDEMDAASQLTAGLVAIVRSARKAHLLGL